jgi:cell division protein FtsI (penicillin-binding protein 3)
VLMDEPKGNAESYGFATGGWAAAPAVGRVVDRIGPFLGVARRPDAPTGAPGDLAPVLMAADEH